MTLATGRVIRECIFKINFLCVLFFEELKKTLAEFDLNRKPAFHWRFCSPAQVRYYLITRSDQILKFAQLLLVSLRVLRPFLEEIDHD